MTAIVLLSPLGVEEAAVPAGQLEVSLGQDLFGKPAVIYRSGWLYAGEGFGFGDGASLPDGPQDAGRPLSLALIGDGLSAAVAVRPAPEGCGELSVQGLDSFSVGHASANGIVYKDRLVSGCHGRFSRDGRGGLVYADLSANGSYVDGKYLHGGRAAVPDGTEILIPPCLRLRFSGGVMTYTRPAGLVSCGLLEKENER